MAACGTQHPSRICHPRHARWDQIADVPDEQGAATFRYPNDQAATTLWYHDHTLGMTRLNVLRRPGGVLPPSRRRQRHCRPARCPDRLPRSGDAPGTTYYEIPIAIQDRSFNADGSLFYPDNRAFFEESAARPSSDIPFIPDLVPGTDEESDVAPIWNPEFFGNTMVVNGKTWPYLDVEPRRYRFRLLNGTQGRALILKTSVPVPMWQIGAEGGFLPAPVPQTQILMSPAERADVIVDFSSFSPGDTVILQNIGPDEPFGGDEPGEDFAPADPGTTGQVMQFRVVPLAHADTSADPATLQLPSEAPLADPTEVVEVSLNELESETVNVSGDDDGDLVYDPDGVPFGPTMALLGTMNSEGEPVPLMWSSPVTETPALGALQTWEISNFTMDAHPIHVHQVQFQVVDRIDADGVHRAPEPAELGFKDTVWAYPGEITRIKARFQIAGLTVWHCHIIEHEDNEMMRPFEVVAPLIDLSFSDVPPTDENYTAIQWLAQRGIVSGRDDGTFGPADPVLRAQLAKMVVIGFEAHNEATTNLGHQTFGDVAYTGEPYPFDYIEEANEAAFMTGYHGGGFGPYDPLDAHPTGAGHGPGGG